jgi:phosphopantothenoylcysteine decarboxylase/phosphopantothenate--cysteine ligase
VLAEKKILLGITGSISAYKVCELIRLLVKAGAKVKVVLTKGGEKFITPCTLSALSGDRVYTESDFFSATGEIAHIELANFPDLVVIAPASASFLAKAASGMADELLSATLLATKAPVYFFPAMNDKMWLHPATQKNVSLLKEMGYVIYEPEEGELACMSQGRGRLPEVSTIFEVLKAHFYPKNLKGKKVLISGGPTREYIDAVRFITNASSGKMAYLLAKEAYYRGGEVFLVWGGDKLFAKFPSLPGIPIPRIFPVRTTREMYEKCKELFAFCDIVIFAAAPVDLRPKKPYSGKLKKREIKRLCLELEITEDIAGELLKDKGERLAIGFALEEKERLFEYAPLKKEKGFDYLVANPLETMGSDASDFYIFTPRGEIELKGVSKEELASRLFGLIGA